MASITKMQILGMRSFGPEQTDRQNVQFFSPLTLILGQNGCGKTTIIECLKYVTTGDVPPGAGKGASFVHDPKMARETSVKGQVKLQFTGIGNRDKIICRSMEASQKLKTIQIKTLDSTITDRTDPSKPVMISSKCADVNNEMMNCLGVTKAILNFVIFCHQEESNWPLEEGGRVKDRFDEIFNSAKYQKCLKNIKDVRKKEMDKAKLEKNDMEHFKGDKQYADTKKKELLRKEDELNRFESQVEEIGKEMSPLRERYNAVLEEEKGFGSIQQKKAEAETSRKHSLEEIAQIERLLKEVISEDVSNEEMEAKKHSLATETEAKIRQQEDYEGKIEEVNRSLASAEKALQKNAAQIGKSVSDKDVHDKNKKEKSKLVEQVSEELEIFDEDSNLSVSLKKEGARLKNQMKQLRLEHKNAESANDVEIDSLKSSKSTLDANKKKEQKEMSEYKREIAQIKRQLNDLDGAAEQLEKINSDWKDGHEKLE